ncbi:MAG: DnaJ domain-containing protein [Verrucomicrobia bacterium]|nr:DnaJ domain-containing protein [Verrucomicrobiota bacterium]MCF7709078.1 DnaJ domain-containing protein [Verrucomicrobiota bacterium]
MRYIIFLILAVIFAVLFPKWWKLLKGEIRKFRRVSHGKDSSESRRYYEKVLQLEGDYTLKDIQSNYRRMVSEYHPDRVRHLGRDLRHLAEKRTRELNEAYEYLRRRRR